MAENRKKIETAIAPMIRAFRRSARISGILRSKVRPGKAVIPAKST